MNFNKDEEGGAFSAYKRLFLPNGIVFEVVFEKECNEKDRSDTDRHPDHHMHTDGSAEGYSGSIYA